MKDERKTKNQLIKRIEELEQSLLKLKKQNGAIPTGEAKLRAYASASPDVMLIMDEKGTYVEILTSQNQLLVSDPEDLLGKNVHEVLSKDEADTFLKIIKQTLKADSPQIVEYELTVQDGRRWFEGRCSKIDGIREPLVVFVTRDITERKRVDRLLLALNQAALAMSTALTPEDTFNAVAQELQNLGLSCMLFPLDESGTKLLTKYSSYDSKMMKSAEKLAGINLSDFSIELDRMDLYRDIVRSKTAALVEDPEVYVRRALPKKLRKLAPQITKILDLPKSIPAPLVIDGKVIGLFAVMSNDLTAEDIPTIVAFADQVAAAFQKAELMVDLKESYADLSEANEKFSKSFYSSPLAMVITSYPDQRLLEMNESFKKLYGVSDEDLVSEVLLEWRMWEDPDDKKYVIEQTQRFGILSDYENRGRTKQGETIYVVSSYVVLETKSGKIMLTTTSDITEKRKAEQGLRESEARYRTLSAAAFEGIGIHKQGIITDGNDQMASILGYEIGELIGFQVSRLVHPGDREFVQNQIKKGNDKPYEHRIIRKDGSTRFLEVRGKRLEIDDQASRVTVIRDITERKRAERLLLALNQATFAMESAMTPEETFESVAQELQHLGFSSVLSLMDENRTQLIPKNISLEAKILKDAEKLTGIPFEEFRINIDSIELIKRVAEEKKAIFVKKTDDILRQALPRGIKRLAPLLIDMLKIPKFIIAPLIVEGNTVGIFSVMSDDLSEDDIPTITAFADQMAAAFTKTLLIEELEGSLAETNRLAVERERLFEEVQLRQRKLQELTTQLASLQESEKEHIAKELHDRVGQSLTALNISLSHSKNLLGSGQIDEAIERIDRAQELVEKTTQQVRDVMAELRPAVLDDYGLFAALNWQAAQHQKLTNITTIVQGSELKPRLDPDTEIALLRIVQEALTNAARYAEATKITISLATAEDSVLLMVEDDGIGFDPSLKEEGWGLVIMQERATAVNGNIEVKSSPGKGTRILVSVPKET